MVKTPGAKMGRPPVKPRDRKTFPITVRVSKAERRQLEAEAAAAGRPVATYLASFWRNRDKGGE
jgi:hypothetical protein